MRCRSLAFYLYSSPVFGGSFFSPFPFPSTLLHTPLESKVFSFVVGLLCLDARVGVGAGISTPAFVFVRGSTNKLRQQISGSDHTFGFGNISEYLLLS